MERKRRASAEGRLGFILQAVRISYGFLRVLFIAQWVRKGRKSVVNERKPGSPSWLLMKKSKGKTGSYPAELHWQETLF